MFKKKSGNRAATKRRAFSIIELVITIAILAVIAAILTPTLLQYIERARAQRDASATSEVTNVVKLGMAREEIYDELIAYSEFDNVSCYVDTPNESEHYFGKVEGSYGRYSFGDQERDDDETPYFAAGNMRGVTITFEPNIVSGGSVYIFKDGMINKFISTEGQTLSNMPNLCASIQVAVGEELKQISQTYRNSEYTIFISLGNEADSIVVYGQYSGTNLNKDDASNHTYITTTDRELSGDGDEDDIGTISDVCDHIIVVEGAISATCQTPGYTGDRMCTECGERVRLGDEIPVVDHIGKLVNKVEPTCSEAGYTGDIVCQWCELLLEQGQEIEPVGHENVKVIASVEPTCDKDGQSEYTVCEDCGEIVEEAVIVIALGHEYEFQSWKWKGVESAVLTLKCTTCEVVKTFDAKITKTAISGTCESAGEVAYIATVTVDKKTYTDTKKETVDAVGHIPGPAATCENPQVCTVCGEVLKDVIDHTSANGGTVDVHKKCKVCGETLEDGSKHVYTSSVMTAATCITKGTTKYTCSCGYVYTLQNIDIDPNNHSGDQVNDGNETKYDCCGEVVEGSHTHSYTNKVTTAATCSSEGVRTYTCNCGKSYTETIAKIAHSVVNGGTKDVHEKCSVCGVTLSTTHTYTSKITSAATCENMGVETYSCECGYHYTESTPKTEHAPGAEANCTNAQTCTVCGTQIKSATGHNSVNGGTKDIHTKCSICGTTLSATHSYNSKVTKEATCTVEGVKTHTCGCGYFYTEGIAKIAHTAGAAANCTTAQTCTVCGTQLAAAKGHTEVNGGTESVHKKCSVCGTTLSNTHSYTNAVSVAATCTTKGTTKYTCSCGYNYTSQNIAINASNHTGSAVNGGTEGVHSKYSCCGVTISTTHSFTNVATSAQCRKCSCGYIDTTHRSVNGGTSGAHTKCGDCGYIISASHSCSYSTVSYASCTSSGTGKYSCGCGYYYTTTISAYGHSYSSSVTTSETCTSNGVRTYSCSCGSSYTESIPATGHNPGAAATCTTAQTCTKCSATITPATGHSYSDATCTTAKTCSKCGATSGSVPGHSWVAATCTEPKTCSRCGTTSGTKNGHSYSAATCTEPKTCSACGKTSGEKLGHNYSSATCTTPQTCSRCGKTKGDTTAHSYSAATCTSPKTCSGCGATSGSKLGHSWNSATCTKAKTCSRCGTTSGSALGHEKGAAATCTQPQTCVRCSYTYKDALGHRWVENETTNKTTCGRCGLSYET